MVTVLAIACLIIFAGFSFHIERSLVYPPFAMAGCWATFLCFHACSRSLLFAIHEETVCFYVAGALAFCLGGLLVHFFCRPRRVNTHYDRARVKHVLSIFLVALALALPLYVRFIVDLVADSTSRNFWTALRQELIQESADTVNGFSLMDNMVVLADIAVLISWYHRDTEKRRTWVAFVLFLIYNLLTAGRAGFVFVLISLFTIEVVRQRRIPWRPLLGLGVVFAVTVFGLAILVGKAGANSNESLADNAPALIEGFQLYTTGALVAFDNLYQNPSAVPPTQNIDRVLKILAKKIGFHVDVPYLHAGYTTVGPFGLDMNVYTIYFTYFPQLGTLGSVGMMGALGTVLTWAYLKAASGGPQAVIMFAILFYGIPMSGYSENYFNNLNFLTKMLVVTCLCYGIRSRRSPLPTRC